MTLYRQKSFFNRWKTKSVGEQQGPGRGGHHGYKAGMAAPRGASSAVMPSRESTFSSRPNGARSLPGTSRGNFEEVLIEEPLKGHKSPARDPLYRKLSTGMRLPLISSGVQTDDDLLESLLTNKLRRRHVSMASAGSNRTLVDESADTMDYSHSTLDSDVHTEELSLFPSGSVKLSGASLKSSSNSGKDRRANGGCSSDTDLLLLHSDVKSEADFSASGNTEHSPLLSADERFACDSTSEETLSEGDYLDSMDDIEDLLSGACSTYEGSFSSLCLAEMDAPSQRRASAESGRGRGQKVTVLLHSHRESPGGDHNTSLSLPQAKAPLASQDTLIDMSPLSPTSSTNIQQHFSSQSSLSTSAQICPVSKISDSVYTRPIPPRPSPPSSLSEPRVKPRGILHGRHSIPEILVVRAPSSSSDNGSHNDGGMLKARSVGGGAGSSSSSSRSSLSEQGNDCKGLDCVTSTPDTGQDGAKSATKGNGNNTANRRSIGSPTDILKMEMLPPLHRDNPDSVAKFQEYLRTRGLELDMKTVQSSDV